MIRIIAAIEAVSTPVLPNVYRIESDISENKKIPGSPFKIRLSGILLCFSAVMQ